MSMELQLISICQLTQGNRLGEDGDGCSGVGGSGLESEACLLLQFMENFTASRSKPEGQAAGIDKEQSDDRSWPLSPLRNVHHP